MTIPEHLLEVRTYTGEGYQPLVDYESWRVAVMNFSEELQPENIAEMQQHDQTDEVFVLLEGHCILFLGEGEETLTRIHAVDMQPLNLYNVKRGAWHTHTLDKQASVLIVENRMTTDENSPFIQLTSDQRSELVDLTKKLWRH
jgi:hypothetical protein